MDMTRSFVENNHEGAGGPLARARPVIHHWVLKDVSGELEEVGAERLCVEYGCLVFYEGAVVQYVVPAGAWESVEISDG